MKIKKIFLLAALGLTATATLTSCEDVLGHWERPTGAVTPSGSETPAEPEEETALPEGALAGKFSVSATKQVYFSKSNLQYNPNTSTWSFMEHQYSTVETDIGVGNDYSSGGIVSLFGWGTSGYNHGANKYQPYSTDNTSSNYYAYGVGSKNLYDDTSKADWGYNKISNGGNTENYGWRTLTGGSNGEWEWLLGPQSSPTPGTNSRTSSTIGGTPNARFVKAVVHSTKGVIIFPDEITWDEATMGTAPTTCNTANDNFTYSPTDDNWTALETAGCVFLPAAGDRNGASVSNAGSDGNYWSSSHSSNANNACSVYFNSGVLNPAGNGLRRNGFSVRLVRPAE